MCLSMAEQRDLLLKSSWVECREALQGVMGGTPGEGTVQIRGISILFNSLSRSKKAF